MPNAEAVERIVQACLFHKGEVAKDPVVAKGVVRTYGFHPGRLHEHEDEIIEQLSDLPATFYSDTGGGWSFLQACYDKDGNLWTGSHMVMETLFCLGLAIGVVKEIPLPREVLPGGVPYYVIERVPDGDEVH